jgi:glyoxylase-like metal-dependent hydrolase (beta-lactamase superfamily II)
MTPADVRGILLTHWHNDHAAGGKAMQQKSNAPVHYHAAEAPYLTRQTAPGGLRTWLSNVIPEWGLFVLFKGLLGDATPYAVEATALVKEGDRLFDDFDVFDSPGHTPGHLCFYYRPERALFAGDALAVVGDRVRFMARPVTPDLKAARASMIRCLSLDIDLLCPGHRAPLTHDTRRHCQEMRDYLEHGGKWPLLG